jgi:hypothetical protein
VNKDTVIGIVGSALLVAAMVVVFAYERANAQVATGEDLEPAIAQSSLSGSVAVGSSDTKTANITAVGPANVTFHLSWSANNGRDTLRLTVTPPPGSGMQASTSTPSDSGDITVTIPVPAGTENAGNWTVKVDFTAAAPDPLPGGIPPPAGGMTDASVSYEVAVAFA